MGITAPLRANPFFGGSSSSSPLVPYTFQVSLAGRPYMIDTVRRDEWRHETVPLLRPQSDDGAEPGAQSLNPEGMWRRTGTSWHKGAGQTHRDRGTTGDDASPFRFRESRGVDVWERHQLTLLNAVDQKRQTSGTNLKLVPAGSRLFLTDGAAVVYTTDITVGSPTWSDTSNEPGGTILDIATDGTTVWITDGANVFDASASASPPDFAGAWSTQDVDTLAFVKGRLVGSHDGVIYSFDAAGAATAVTMTAVRLPSSWTCVGFAGGPTNSVIYAAGFSGDKSLVLRIGVREDGSGLDAAIVAAELPDGEIVRSIATYLGFVLIGTDNGVRFATPDSEGNLTIGALLETGAAVRCFEGQGPFVWFGWEDFTESIPDGSTYHGLGRLSLEEFSSAENLAPAYATDLMNTANGTVSSVVTFQDVRVWCVEGTDFGVYAQEATIGTSGYLLAGVTDFDVVGHKTAISLDLEYDNPASSTISIRVDADDAAEFPTAGTVNAGTGTETFPAGPLRGTRFEVLIQFTASGSSPLLHSYALQATPAIQSTLLIQVPLLLNEHLDPNGGVEYVSVDDERNVLKGLWESQQPVVYNELGTTSTVVVKDFVWLPRLRDDSTEGWAADGTFLATLKEVA